ncbi:hypothetical protein ASD51_30905 [Streptomyces sp. Root55]|nr:hypothetical protein ASD51_30905 [Streptomyces sp. Root55]
MLPSAKGQRLDGTWGSIHTTALHENTVAASALYNEQGNPALNVAWIICSSVAGARGPVRPAPCCRMSATPT